LLLQFYFLVRRRWHKARLIRAAGTPPNKPRAARRLIRRIAQGCHGTRLEGGMGPALVGKQLWRMYGGEKISTLWSAVHRQMPMMAPGSVFARNSINIMAFLLQKNGLPSGRRPLDDTVDLSKALPPK
jgi:hypothetical protein